MVRGAVMKAGICAVCEGEMTCTYPFESRQWSLQCDEFSGSTILHRDEGKEAEKLNPSPGGVLQRLRALHEKSTACTPLEIKEETSLDEKVVL